MKYIQPLKFNELEQKLICDDYVAGLSQKELINKYKSCFPTILKVIKRNNIPLRRMGGQAKYTVNENFFEKIDSHEKAQILGFIYADGSITKRTPTKKAGSDCVRIEIQQRDEIILTQMANIMGYNGKFYFKEIENKKYSKLQISRKKIVEDLIKLGCSSNKTFDLQFPFNNVPEEFWGSLVYGYWLGDGWATSSNTKRGYKTFYCGIISNNKFIEDLIYIIKNKLAINSFSQNKHWRTIGVSTLSIANKIGFIKFTQWMLKDSILDIPRKTQKIREITEYLLGK